MIPIPLGTEKSSYNQIQAQNFLLPDRTESELKVEKFLLFCGLHFRKKGELFNEWKLRQKWTIDRILNLDSQTVAPKSEIGSGEVGIQNQIHDIHIP